MPFLMARAGAIAGVAVMLAGARAFVLTPTLLSRCGSTVGGEGSRAAPPGRRSFSLGAAPLEGTHGMRSLFLPVDQLDDETFAPRIVQVAGALPDVTVADIMAVGFTPPSEMGMWQYDFSDPGGPQMGKVAVPGGELMHNMKEPVAIVIPNADLNIQMPENEAVELLMIVDRANREFELAKFFLWETPDAGLQVRFFEGEVTPGFKCIGRVGLVLSPYVPSMKTKFTGFEEEEY